MATSDALHWAGLEISFQRLARRAWSAATVVRSWDQCPWQRRSDHDLAVAILPDEVVWLGLNTTGRAAQVRLSSRGGRWSRTLAVPPDWQLAWLSHDGADSRRRQPIALRRGCGSASFVIEVRRAGAVRPQMTTLTLLAPEAWRRTLGPLNISPAEQPEDVLQYSRIMPAGLRGAR